MGTFPDNWTGKTIGVILREAREAKGASIEEAARVTRIGKNYLAALEGDLPDKLPNPAYVKGFLRIYSSFLGLPGDQLIARYDADSVPAPVPAAEKSDTSPVRQEIRHHPKGRWYIPLLLLGVVIVASFLFGEREKPQPQQPAPAPVAAAPTQPVMTSAAVASPAPPAPVDAAGETMVASAPPAPGGGGILKLKVNQDSLLTITVDNSFSQQYDLKAGDLIEWKGERVFTLDISNGGGVEAELNGRPLPPFGPAGKPTMVVVKTDDAAPTAR